MTVANDRLKGLPRDVSLNPPATHREKEELKAVSCDKNIVTTEWAFRAIIALFELRFCSRPEAAMDMHIQCVCDADCPG